MTDTISVFLEVMTSVAFSVQLLSGKEVPFEAESTTSIDDVCQSISRKLSVSEFDDICLYKKSGDVVDRSLSVVDAGFASDSVVQAISSPSTAKILAALEKYCILVMPESKYREWPSWDMHPALIRLGQTDALNSKDCERVWQLLRIMYILLTSGSRGGSFDDMERDRAWAEKSLVAMAQVLAQMNENHPGLYIRMLIERMAKKNQACDKDVALFTLSEMVKHKNITLEEEQMAQIRMALSDDPEKVSVLCTENFWLLKDGRAETLYSAAAIPDTTPKQDRRQMIQQILNEVESELAHAKSVGKKGIPCTSFVGCTDKE